MWQALPGSSLQLLQVWKDPTLPAGRPPKQSAVGWQQDLQGFSISCPHPAHLQPAKQPPTATREPGQAMSTLQAEAPAAAFAPLLQPGQLRLAVQPLVDKPAGQLPSQVHVEALHSSLGWHLVAHDARPSIFLYNHTSSQMQVGPGRPAEPAAGMLLA